MGRRSNGDSLWITIGKAWERDDGTLSLDVGALPLSSRWNGTLFLIPDDPSSGRRQGFSGGRSRDAYHPHDNSPAPRSGGPVGDDDIPF